MKYLLLLGFWTLLSCGGKNTSPLLSDGVSSTSCASSGCAVVDSNAYLAVKKTSTYYAKKSDMTVEINGDCFLADSVSHSINLSLKQGLNSFVAGVRGLNIASPDNASIRCVEGKFGFLLDISTLAIGVYNLSGQLVLGKKDGTTSSPGTGSFIVNVSISN